MKYLISIFCLRLILPIISSSFATLTYASNELHISEICNSAATVASKESGVPIDVLRAITLTETGRKGDSGFQPWPWTVNMEGIGKWFATMMEAQEYVDRHFGRGARSFDVGCFQINYRWHHQAFNSIEEMFDPLTNARYAARFLGDLHAELGSWSKAAGAYHSRTPKFANKYRTRFDRIRANLTDLPTLTLPATFERPEPPLPSPIRVNRYPLLQSGESFGAASLVPKTQAPTRFITVNRRSGLIGSR